MSSVGRKEELNRLKDYYSQRETENNNKHKQQIDAIKQEHTGEVDGIKSQAKAELDQERGRMREKLTVQDKKHQKEIDALREIYEKRAAKM